MILLWVHISYMKLPLNAVKSSFKICKTSPCTLQLISYYSCPPGRVQRSNFISLTAFPSVNFTLTWKPLRQNADFAVCFTGLQIFASKYQEDNIQVREGSNRSIYPVSQPPIFKTASALLIRHMFCKEAPLGSVRSVPGIHWTWGHAVKAPEKCSD